MPEPSSLGPALERFEVVSRGDFVPCRLWRAGDTAPPAIVWILAPPQGAKHAPPVEALGQALASAGFAAAAIDLPLQGGRASPKLSARLGADQDPGLWQAFLAQAVLDLGAAQQALRSRPALADARVACLAFPSAEPVARAWAAVEPGRVVLHVETGAGVAALVERVRRALTRD